MKGYRRAKKRIAETMGESVRIVRKRQNLSQNELARPTGISQTAMLAMEDGQDSGVTRVEPSARGRSCRRGSAQTLGC